MSMNTSQAHFMSLKLGPATAPTSVLYSIFHHLATGWTDAIPINVWLPNILTTARYGTEFYHDTVYSAALVNKHWNSVATLVIYESIRVCMETKAKNLRETLEQSPYLASIVTRLDLGTIYHSRDDTQCHIDIIGLCPNLQHLKIGGYNAYLLDEFGTALKKSTRLRSLYITRYGESDRESAAFCSVAEMLEMFKCWPDLESVHFHGSALAEWSEDFPRDFDATPIKSLKSFSTGCTLEKDELAAVMRMTPNLELFSINDGGFRDGKSVAKALEGWKESLVSVDLYREEDRNRTADDSEWKHVTAVLPSLTRLQHLTLSSTFPASTCTTAFPPSLKTLYIWISKASDLEHINAALQKEGYIPKLHALQISKFFSEKFVTEELEKLENECKRRGCELILGR